MNANALRISGIVVSFVLMVGALVIAWQPAPLAEAQQQRAAEAVPERPTPISFVVRFRGAGPIARAQRLAQRGQLTEAQRQIEIQLRRQDSFRGLCFDRFTVGASDVVLRTCAAIVPSERANMEQRWLAQLRAIRGVAYADLNETATRERAS